MVIGPAGLIEVRRSSCLSVNKYYWARSFVVVILIHMAGHVDEHGAHMGIRHFIEYLLAVSLATDEARAAQEAQMVADQRLRQIGQTADHPSKKFLTSLTCQMTFFTHSDCRTTLFCRFVDTAVSA